ncbi:hypothetical protein BVRB_8g187050 [Beta vulgaris subsp. vulgaris]|nr:hypothetical protein BVRB_8g187050 [Beta vulgaris subsp. vulgaris]
MLNAYTNTFGTLCVRSAYENLVTVIHSMQRRLGGENVVCATSGYTMVAMHP